MGTTFPALLISIVLGPVCAFAILFVVKWMLNNELDFLSGLIAIIALFLALSLTVMSRSEIVAGAVLVVLITLMAFLPYAVEQFAHAELRGVDIDRLDRTYREISERPENVASRFALATCVYELGLPGHAIAIAERTLDLLSREIDPLTNQSLRDVFRSEEQQLRQWKRVMIDPKELRPAKCVRCGHANEPGNIACGKCQGPFLLDLARRIDPRPKIRSRLVLGWALVAGFFTGTVYVWSIVEGTWTWLSLGVGLCLVGGTFAWLFRPRSLSTR